MRGDSGFIHGESKFKRWSWVRTADGTLCQVQSGRGSNGELELRSEHGTMLLLPEAELKRAVHPRNRKPPIQGMPEPRPLCPWCDRKLRPVVDVKTAKDALAGPKPFQAGDVYYTTGVIRREFVRWSAYQNVFCSATCAVAFAGAAYRGGYRRVKGPEGSSR